MDIQPIHHDEAARQIMTRSETVKKVSQWKVLDDVSQGHEPFDTDREELERLGRQSRLEGVIHFYQPNALILGKIDRKLPRFHEAEDWADRAQIPRTLRISGGQMIVSDPGVLNISILMSTTEGKIAEGFQDMAMIINEVFKRISGQSLEVGKIERSYCPGDYDLSHGGKKVAGIAQRRVKGAVGLMAYVSVCGDQEARARLVSEYYRRGGADVRFPVSDPGVMTTINDILRQLKQAPTTVETFKQHLVEIVTDARRSACL